jgi:hypothetical protein
MVARSDYEAAVLAYVRTEDGEVVQVDEGHVIPVNVDPDHLEQLLAAGVAVEREPAEKPTPQKATGVKPAAEGDKAGDKAEGDKG